MSPELYSDTPQVLRLESSLLVLESQLRSPQPVLRTSLSPFLCFSAEGLPQSSEEVDSFSSPGLFLGSWGSAKALDFGFFSGGSFLLSVQLRRCPRWLPRKLASQIP